MRTALEGLHLEDIGVVRVSGTDAVKFLQGQLSSDVSTLSAERSLLAGYHNPQGRTIAVLRLVLWAGDCVVCVVPGELAGGVAGRLAKYVLRAKAKIAADSAAWRVVGLTGVGPSDWPASIGAQTRTADGTVIVCVGERPGRWLAIEASARDTAAAAADGSGASAVLDYTPVDRATWRRLEVASGQPQVYSATSEAFVAQMLNLDAVRAIAFDKGCYTGQEVIARAHYRGRVKRRMQRFVSRGPCALSPGDTGKLSDGRGFEIVMSAPLEDGRCEFLAVAALAAGEVGSAGTDAAAGAVVDAEQVELPYPLPD